MTFEVGTDLDFAQVLVQNRVSAAMAQLPAPVQQQGVVTKKKETSPLQIITLSSKGDRFDALFLSNFATLQLSRQARAPAGRGRRDRSSASASTACASGSTRSRCSSARSCRRDVVSALQAQNAYVAAGQVGMPPTPVGPGLPAHGQRPGLALRRLGVRRDHPEDRAGGADHAHPDVGRVELGARSYSQVFRMDGRPAGGIAIYQLPGANALDTAKGVRKLLATPRPGLSAGAGVRRFRSTRRRS